MRSFAKWPAVRLQVCSFCELEMKFEHWGTLMLGTPGWCEWGVKLCSRPRRHQVGWEAGQGRGDRDPSDIDHDSGQRCPKRCCKVRLWYITPIFVSIIFKYAMQFNTFIHKSLQRSICRAWEDKPFLWNIPTSGCCQGLQGLNSMSSKSQSEDLVWW